MSGIFKQCSVGRISVYFKILDDDISSVGTEPPFMANLFFGYAQNGPDRIYFSVSTVMKPIFGVNSWGRVLLHGTHVKDP